MISLIVAMARNRVIGAGNKIPWHLPNELKLFKSLTMGHHIVMGRRGLGSYTGAVLGSVAQKTLQLAEQPVLLVG